MILLGLILFISGLAFDDELIERFGNALITFSELNRGKLLFIRLGLVLIGVALVIFSILRIAGNVKIIDLEQRANLLIAERPFYQLLIAFWIVVLTFSTFNALSNTFGWRDAKGWEYYTIGVNLAEGPGFSFENSKRLIYSPQTIPAEKINEYSATALEEPIYVTLIAFALSTWGDSGKEAVLTTRADREPRNDVYNRSDQCVKQYEPERQQKVERDFKA